MQLTEVTSSQLKLAKVWSFAEEFGLSAVHFNCIMIVSIRISWKIEFLFYFPLFSIQYSEPQRLSLQNESCVNKLEHIYILTSALLSVVCSCVVVAIFEFNVYLQYKNRDNKYNFIIVIIDLIWRSKELKCS